MSPLLTQLREAAAAVARRARHVRINTSRIADYSASLPLDDRPTGADETPGISREERAAFWLTLDAVNFGSGWFPTLNKAPGRSGYHTIAAALRERFASRGPWSPEELTALTAADVARTLSQAPSHELMALFADSLNDLGEHVSEAGGFAAVVDAAGDSAAALVERLAAWPAFADTSTYAELTLPFLKRAQILAADLSRAGVAEFDDLHRLTLFADNLVPHVLRLDGILGFDARLVQRIEREELIAHGSPEEVEIRACALWAVELIVAARPGTTGAEIDQLLWLRGQGPRYKAVPRHRSRTTAY
ncbi:MAG TPA: queuosine salvage family protein [Solirubrobacteraceae bacterium]|nr:queuosine salvage family protein [Solirubrobacteraceae bacterium]